LKKKIREIKKIHYAKEDRNAKDNKKKFYSFFDNIADPVFIYDAISYNFLHCNKSAKETFGFSKEELLTMTPFDLHKPEEYEKLRNSIAKQTTKSPETFTYITKDRKFRIVETRTDGLYFESKPAWMTIVHDITDRIKMEDELRKYRSKLEAMVNERTLELLLSNKKLKEEIKEREKAEHAILESEKKIRSMIEHSLDGVILVDEVGTIIEWNKSQEKIYGVKNPMVVGKKIWDVQFQYEPKTGRNAKKKKTIKGLWENFFEMGINPFEDSIDTSQIERPDGKIRDIQQLYYAIKTDNGLMMAATTRDITAKLAMEKQLMQSQKMEAMGVMAGGIAHDFNNILGGIIGYTELAIRKTSKTTKTQKYLDQVLTASRRAKDLVKQILAFSRQEIKEKEPVQLGLIVKEVLKLLRSSLPASIEIATKLEAEKSYIHADSTQLHQVIMNLCTNAWHAMKKTGGLIEVRLNEEIVEAGLYKELKAGSFLRLTISDTGCGIKQEMLDKIFEPFFTTKNVGEGTGMGLAVVHGIVNSHNGNISVYSKEGQGTSFSILLPVIANVIHKQEKQGEVPLGNERILLVEDDSALAVAEKRLYEGLGYKVSMMHDGFEAFELFSKVPEKFDIIITDYSMPKMTGLELIHKIRLIDTRIPVILCTGFSKIMTPKESKAIDIGDIIMKPIELGYIARSIRKLLDK
ncbi:MAG: PAS domain S-box protein, partial [bacterium]|nr:PAS domain S-box protein [bacterium]